MDRPEILCARATLMLDYGATDISHHGVECVQAIAPRN